MRLGLAFRCFWRALTDPPFAERVEPLLAEPAAVEEKPSGEPLRLLAILQRDGRLVDFLTEDLTGYTDDQIGAAVRDIHRDCRKVLERYVDLGPVMDQTEGATVTVPAGFNPLEIRLTGNVVGTPPFKGSLAHRGWRVRSLHLPDTLSGPDAFILAPAEVEIP